MSDNNQFIIDTNILVRFFVRDHEEHYQQVVEWLKKGKDGAWKLMVGPVVIAEATYVLESMYHKKRIDIIEAFEVFLSQRWLVVEDREVLLRAFFWYGQNLHFVDSFLLAWSESRGVGVLTFDKQINKKKKK